MNTNTAEHVGLTKRDTMIILGIMIFTFSAGTFAFVAMNGLIIGGIFSIIEGIFVYLIVRYFGIIDVIKYYFFE